MATGFQKIIVLLCVFLLYVTLPLVQAERHSLYYIYTALSKPVGLPGIYEFTAMGLLDDTQIDYYDSKDKKKIPTQSWIKEKMQEDYWEKGTQSRKGKEQWFNVNIHILMNRMRHDKSDLHVLQWRVGCEVEQQGGEFKFSKGINEYSYDGENFLSFDDKESQWVAPVDEALPTKRKWDNMPILNQYTKEYLEKECVDWLNKFREYGDEKLRNTSPPDVHVFAKRSYIDETKLKLTCMVTGFYHKDVLVIIRINRIPVYETKSTGVRPNHDGSFQMRKSVEIKEGDEAEYDCVVTHRTLKGPIINKWDVYYEIPSEIHRLLIGVAFGAVFVLTFAALLVYILVKKRRLVFHRRYPPERDVFAEVPLLEVYSTNTSEHEDENAGLHLLEGQDTAGGLGRKRKNLAQKEDSSEAWSWRF